MSLSKTSFNFSNIRANQATLTVSNTLKDASNNTSTCQAQVTTKDNLAPTALCENTIVQLGAATLAFQLPSEQAFSCRVFDLSGRMVYSQGGLGVVGENSLPMPMGGLVPGVYWVDFQSNNWKVQKKLVLQR